MTQVILDLVMKVKQGSLLDQDKNFKERAHLDQALIARMLQLQRQHSYLTARDLLEEAGNLLMEAIEPDVITAYELIPETGGIPRVPPIYLGVLVNPEVSLPLLSMTCQTSVLGELIENWTVCAWSDNEIGSERSGFEDFMRCEGIKSFIFLPLGYHHTKLGALVLNFRDIQGLSDEHRVILEVFAFLAGSALVEIYQSTSGVPAQKSRMAIAHTLYNEVATKFKVRLEELKNDVEKALAELGISVPSVIAEGLEDTKITVFDVMRDLVIKASGNVLIDLHEMSLYKALSTAAAALERAWPQDRKVKIDVQDVPLFVERLPFRLRQLLYTLALEAMGNAVRHGGPAPYVSVSMDWDGEQIYVQVIDHGCGFDLTEVKLSEHGLGFWKDYVVQQLAGEFKVASSPGHGTVIVAKIPVMAF